MQVPAADTDREVLYEIDGRRYEAGTPGFSQAIAEAHARRQRLRCLCRHGNGAAGTAGAAAPTAREMYVARLAGPHGGYTVKRMPETGSQHAPGCPSYESPADLSGLGQVLGSAISENPATGETALRLDFAMSKLPGRAAQPPAGSEHDSVATDGTRLTLRGLLHYLWDQAGLTRWQPGFAGRRNWAVVRKLLLQGAENKTMHDDPLLARLYVPEMFTLEHREAIDARRRQAWTSLATAPGKPQPLMLMIGEVKEILPARYGFKAVVKHLPDLPLLLDEQLHRRLGRRFEAELALWGASDDLHMVMVATFGLGPARVPALQVLSLMPVTREWLPVEDASEKQLVERLVAEGRSFVKGLRYNLNGEHAIASAVLTDSDGDASLYIDGGDGACVLTAPDRSAGDEVWVWNPCSAPMPALPAISSRRNTWMPESVSSGG